MYQNLYSSHVKPVLDMFAASFEQQKWLVSRKCNMNLFDLAAIWKCTVLAHLPQDDLSIDNVDAWVK